MMVDKKGHKCRNIQEQVGKNTCDIKELKERTPSTDFVLNATKNESGDTLHIKQKVDGVMEEFDFKGGGANDLEAGVNINLDRTTHEGKVIINATTEPVGSVAFENIAGDPHDNEALDEELNNKVNLTGGNTMSGNQIVNGWLTLNTNSGLSVKNQLDSAYSIYFSTGINFYPADRTPSYVNLFFGRVSGTIAVTSQVDAVQSQVNDLKFKVNSVLDPMVQEHEAEINALDEFKQDGLIAGTNITLTRTDPHHMTISATGGSGTSDYNDLTNKPQVGGVTLQGNKSLDDLSIQHKLTAGTNITIANNVINATGGGEPEEYIKSASVSGNTLTLVDQDDQEIGFTPSSEGGITDVKVDGNSVVTDGVANINGMVKYNEDNSIDANYFKITASAPSSWTYYKTGAIEFNNGGTITRLKLPRNKGEGEFTFATLDDIPEISGVSVVETYPETGVEGTLYIKKAPVIANVSVDQRGSIGTTKYYKLAESYEGATINYSYDVVTAVHTISIPQAGIEFHLPFGIMNPLILRDSVIWQFISEVSTEEEATWYCKEQDDGSGQNIMLPIGVDIIGVSHISYFKIASSYRPDFKFDTDRNRIIRNNFQVLDFNGFYAYRDFVSSALNGRFVPATGESDADFLCYTDDVLSFEKFGFVPSAIAVRDATGITYLEQAIYKNGQYNTFNKRPDDVLSGESENTVESRAIWNSYLQITPIKFVEYEHTTVSGREVPDLSAEQVINSVQDSVNQGKPIILSFDNGTGQQYYNNIIAEMTNVSRVMKIDMGDFYVKYTTNPSGSEFTTEVIEKELDADKLLDVLQGSDTVVVDKSEDDEHVEVHLDADVVSKLDRALLTPLTHTEETLVGVDTTGAQEQIKIGSGLSVVNGALTATNTDAKTIYDICHPVGSLVYFDHAVDMSKLSNGIWEELQENTFIASHGLVDAGQFNGSNDAVVVEHTHTAESVGTHTHGVGTYKVFGTLLGNVKEGWIESGENGFNLLSGGSSNSGISSTGTGVTDRLQLNAYSGKGFNGSSEGSGSHTHTINNSGVSGTNANMPKYYATYIYRRLPDIIKK